MSGSWRFERVGVLHSAVQGLFEQKLHSIGAAQGGCMPWRSSTLLLLDGVSLVLAVIVDVVAFELREAYAMFRLR